MRFVMTLLLGTPLLLLSGCDKPSGPQGQEETAASAPQRTAENSREDVALETASGMKAVLTYTHSGSPAPNIAFTGADGRDVSLRDFSGRPLLVNIWATWCAPCKEEMPTIDALAKIKAGTISVIAVSQDLEGRVPVMDFFAATGVENLEPYTDPDNALLGAYGGNIVLPTTILYGSASKEVWRVEGSLEWDGEEAAKLLAEAG